MMNNEDLFVHWTGESMDSFSQEQTQYKAILFNKSLDTIEIANKMNED